MSVDIQDLITCAAFCDDRLRGLDVARGRILIFPLTCVVALTTLSHYRASVWWRRDIAKNDFQYGVRSPSSIWKISIFFSNLNARDGNLYLCTKFDRNRIITAEIWSQSYFSKWRPSWISEIAVLVTWPISACDSSSQFRNSHITVTTTPKYDFQYGVRPPPWIWKISIFVKFPCSEWKSAPVHQIWSKSDNSRLRYGNKAIFKMAAVRHLEFSKLQFWSRDLYRHVILHLCSKFRVDRQIWRRDNAKKRR